MKTWHKIIIITIFCTLSLAVMLCIIFNQEPAPNVAAPIVQNSKIYVPHLRPSSNDLCKKLKKLAEAHDLSGLKCFANEIAIEYPTYVPAITLKIIIDFAIYGDIIEAKSRLEKLRNDVLSQVPIEKIDKRFLGDIDTHISFMSKIIKTYDEKSITIDEMKKKHSVDNALVLLPKSQWLNLLSCSPEIFTR